MGEVLLFPLALDAGAVIVFHEVFHGAGHGVALLEEVLGLPVEVQLGLQLIASVALDPPAEVVVLALRADPASVGEVELASHAIELLVTRSQDILRRHPVLVEGGGGLASLAAVS
ncbi:MAG: hypothetical protein ACMG6E_10170 [Candidatus Roizmanbacteria bacterium]